MVAIYLMLFFFLSLIAAGIVLGVVMAAGKHDEDPPYG